MNILSNSLLLKSLITRRLFPRGVLVLLYHRISSVRVDPFLLSVTPAHFQDQIKMLKKDGFNFINPDEFKDIIINTRKYSKDVLITFDDGYVDNLTNALPILEKEKVPALFHITSNVINKKPFWWDLVKDLTMVNQMKGMPIPKRETLTSSYKAFADRRPMDIEELRKFSESTYVYIGGHTQNHPSLATQPKSIQFQEIAKNKRQLETLLKKKINYFSYPFGGISDVNFSTINIASKFYSISFSTLPYLANHNFDRHFQPRVLVRDWNGAELLRQIHNRFTHYLADAVHPSN